MCVCGFVGQVPGGLMPEKWEKEGKIYRNLQRRCIINLAGGMDGEKGCRDIDPDQTRTRKKV